MDFNWTYEAEERLKDKWFEGWTAGAIARWFSDTYHHPFTRNAIMGKINRLGLPRRIPSEKLPKRTTPPKAKIKPWAPRRAHIKPPSGREVSFMDLEWDMCRYIPGNPSEAKTMYCGDPVLGVFSYCPHHYMLCHMKMQRLVSSRAVLTGAVTSHPPSEPGGGSDLPPVVLPSSDNPLPSLLK